MISQSAWKPEMIVITVCPSKGNYWFWDLDSNMAATSRMEYCGEMRSRLEGKLFKNQLNFRMSNQLNRTYCAL